MSEIKFICINQPIKWNDILTLYKIYDGIFDDDEKTYTFIGDNENEYFITRDLMKLDEWRKWQIKKILI